MLEETKHNALRKLCWDLKWELLAPCLLHVWLSHSWGSKNVHCSPIIKCRKSSVILIHLLDVSTICFTIFNMSWKSRNFISLKGEAIQVWKTPTVPSQIFMSEKHRNHFANLCIRFYALPPKVELLQELPALGPLTATCFATAPWDPHLKHERNTTAIVRDPFLQPSLCWWFAAANPRSYSDPLSRDGSFTWNTEQRSRKCKRGRMQNCSEIRAKRQNDIDAWSTAARKLERPLLGLSPSFETIEYGKLLTELREVHEVAKEV